MRRRRIATYTIPQSNESHPTTSAITQISENPPIPEDHMEPSPSRNTRSRNPISSSPIFIPNVTLRKRESCPAKIVSRCTIILNERISQIFGSPKNVSIGTHPEPRISFGKLVSLLIFSHICRVVPERFLILPSSIFTLSFCVSHMILRDQIV